MAEPFISEIRLFGFAFAPKGWAQCNGQTMPINQNQALFALLGTTYGGNGVTTFNLPDLRGRVPVHFAPPALPQGASAGAENVTLSTAQLPQHTHLVNATSDQANVRNFDGAAVATAMDIAVLPPQATNLYGAAANLVPLGAESVGSAGGSQPHGNLQPSLVLNFCIALQGVFPSRN